jgi:hypothetical protein
LFSFATALIREEFATIKPIFRSSYLWGKMYFIEEHWSGTAEDQVVVVFVVVVVIIITPLLRSILVFHDIVYLSRRHVEY